MDYDRYYEEEELSEIDDDEYDAEEDGELDDQFNEEIDQEELDESIAEKSNNNNNNNNNEEHSDHRSDEDINELIDSVYLAPFTPMWIRSLVKNVMEKYAIQKTIVNSVLEGKPVY